MSDQLQLVATATPEAGATPTPAGASSAAPPCGDPAGAIPARPSDQHVLRGMCRECGKWPDIDPLTLNMKHHRYRKSDVRGRRGRCIGVGTAPVSYSWVVPLA